MVQDLSLPSLDDLLADDNPSDADGLFSGFHTLSNQEVDMLSAPDRDASHSRQHSNNVSGTTSEGHTHSDGSEGETSQTKAHLNNAQASHTQAVPAKAQSKQAADPTTGGPATANTGSTITASTSTEQPASPSLVGMTAAEVAQALGLDAAKQPHTQHGKYSAPLPAAQAPARKQANGRKKRGRDVEAAVTSSGASEQHASSAVAADMASRAGSPGVSSSSDVTPAEVQQEPVSSANTAADKEEEHKRMVCQPCYLFVLALLSHTQTSMLELFPERFFACAVLRTRHISCGSLGILCNLYGQAYHMLFLPPMNVNSQQWSDILCCPHQHSGACHAGPCSLGTHTEFALFTHACSATVWS